MIIKRSVKPIYHSFGVILLGLVPQACNSAKSDLAPASLNLPSGVHGEVNSSALCRKPAVPIYRSESHNIAILGCSDVTGALVQYGVRGHPSFTENVLALPNDWSGSIYINAVGPKESPTLFIANLGDMHLKGTREAIIYNIKSGSEHRINLIADQNQTLPTIFVGNRSGALSEACIAILWRNEGENSQVLKVFGAEALLSPIPNIDAQNPNSPHISGVSLKWRADDLVLGCDREGGEFQIALNRVVFAPDGTVQDTFGWTGPISGRTGFLSEFTFRPLIKLNRIHLVSEKDPNFSAPSGNLFLATDGAIVVRKRLHEIEVIPSVGDLYSLTLDRGLIWGAFDPNTGTGFAFTRTFDGFASGYKEFYSVRCRDLNCEVSRILSASGVKAGSLFPSDSGNGSPACPFTFVPEEGWRLHLPWSAEPDLQLVLAPGTYVFDCKYLFGAAK